MKKSALIEKVKGFPATPGVYLMKDGRGRVLYVGKSVSLKDRVLSYFRGGEAARPNIVLMMDKVKDVDFVETPSEIDALLAEQRLIKDLHPRYNVDLKDDKSYPYLEIGRSRAFPRVLVTREIKRGSKVYGPFMDVEGLRQAVVLLQRCFKFRVCSLEIRENTPKYQSYRPCLYHHIGSCLAPCAGKVTRAEYKVAIGRLRKFLEGKSMTVIRDVKREMEAAAAELDFERAAVLRDQFSALESLARRPLAEAAGHVGSLDYDPGEGISALAKVLETTDEPRLIEAVDAATMQGGESVGSIVTFVDGRPFKDGYRRYKIKGVRGVDDYAMIQEVVRRRYRRLKKEEGMLPHLLLVDGGPGQLGAALKALEEAGARPALVASLAKREELVFVEGRDEAIELPRTSPALKVLQAARDEAHRFAQHYHHVLRGRKMFGTKAARIAKSARTAKRRRRKGNDSEKK